MFVNVTRAASLYGEVPAIVIVALSATFCGKSHVQKAMALSVDQFRSKYSPLSTVGRLAPLPGAACV